MRTDNINEIKEKRAELVQEMKDYLEAYEADEFKYYENIMDFKFIIEELEDLREQELDILGNRK